jgi:hypothetical protein
MTDSLHFNKTIERYGKLPRAHQFDPALEDFVWRGNDALINPTFPQSAARSQSILDRSDIQLLDVPFLSDNLPLARSLVLVKSAKNTGKTTALESYLCDRNKSVLVVAHRNSLVRKLAADYKLWGHLSKNGPEEERAKRSYEASRVAVTLDSLWKVQRKRPFDVLVVDESEQVLAHFFANTMQGRQNSAARALVHFAVTAKQLIALDADLSWSTLNFFGTARPNDRPIIVRNTHQPARGRTLLVHGTKGAITREIFAAAKVQSCFVVSDEKRFLERLMVSLQNSGLAEARTLMISSSTAKSQMVRAYLSCPRSQKDRYDVVLASPTISSGIDIAFEGDEPVYQRVFGVFHGHQFTHYECDQLLSRVRNPGRIEVWITGHELEKRQRYSSSFHDDAGRLQSRPDQIEQRVLSALRNSTLLDYRPDGDEIFDVDHPLVALAQTVFSERITSRQFLARNFLQAKQAEGWEIIPVDQQSCKQLGFAA